MWIVVSFHRNTPENLKRHKTINDLDKVSKQPCPIQCLGTANYIKPFFFPSCNRVLYKLQQLKERGLQLLYALRINFVFSFSLVTPILLTFRKTFVRMTNELNTRYQYFQTLRVDNRFGEKRNFCGDIRDLS